MAKACVHGLASYDAWIANLTSPPEDVNQSVDLDLARSLCQRDQQAVGVLWIVRSQRVARGDAFSSAVVKHLLNVGGKLNRKAVGLESPTYALMNNAGWRDY